MDMGSFLKRIPPLAKFQSKSDKSLYHISFEIDEPEFLLKRKFNAISDITHNNDAVQKYLRESRVRVCPYCGNSEFSAHANFCKVCGNEVSF